MAKAIDDHLGRNELINTVVGGPKLFFTLYDSICATDSQLPKLPPDVMTAVDQMPEKIDPAMIDDSTKPIDEK
jgi:hypothetical protein